MQFIKKIPLHLNTFLEYNLILLRRKNLLTWSLVGVVISLVIMYFDILTDITLSVIVGIIMGAFFVGLTYFLAVRKTKKQTLRIYQEQKIDEMELVYTINAKGVKQENNLESFHFPWNRFKSIKETPLALYFFYTKANALVISKAALTESELQDIQNLIAQNYRKK